MRALILSVIVFLSAAATCAVCQATGISALFVKFTNWLYTKPMLEQAWIGGLIGLGVMSPLIWAFSQNRPFVMGVKVNATKQDVFHKFGVDSQTGEPIKSISQILREGEQF